MDTKDKRKYRYLSWEDIEKASLSIYSEMCRDGYAPQSIIALLRGGIVPARLFSDFFNILLDFFALDVTLYDSIGIRKPEPTIKPFNGDVKGKRVLIVDDIYDSGKTMKAVLEYLKGEDITTATLYWKETANGKPDYYAEVVKENEWLVFPFEKYEFWREINGNK